MSPEQADTLAKRIMNCWYGGPPVDEWRDLLVTLEHQAAVTAYERLRIAIDNPPSCRRFKVEYDAIAPRPDPPTVASHDIGPRLTREQRVAILLRNGAPSRFVNPGANPL